MSRRTERLASAIRQELAPVIQHELNDPRISGLPSITRVKVTEDLATAEVYLTIMGPPAQQTLTLNAIRHSAGLMRSRLTKSLSIRQVPYLQFHLDEALKKELEVLELIDQVAKENAELDRKRAEMTPADADAAQDAPQQDAGEDTNEERR